MVFGFVLIIMHAQLFLTQTALDLVKIHQIVAWNYFENGSFDLTDTIPNDVKIKEYWDKRRTMNQIRIIDVDSKSDFRKVASGLYQRYSQPTMLFLGDLGKYSEPLQESLLKLLEEPPHNLIVILYSHVRSDILPTIASRCRIVSLPDSIVLHSLDQKMVSQVEKKLPKAREFTQQLLAQTAFILPDLSKIEREEIDFWLWQISYNLQFMYAQNSQFSVAELIKKVLVARQLNRQNLQKKFALGWMRV